MTSRVTVGSDGGVQKTLTGKQADKVKAGVKRLLKRGDAAPIKPGQTMPSSGGRAPRRGGVEVVRGDVAIKASTELVRGARLALAERVLEAVDDKTADVNKKFFANLRKSSPSPADKLRKGAAAAGEGFDKVRKNAQRAGNLIRKRATGQTTDQTTKP